jgi:hypothetical protein
MPMAGRAAMAGMMDQMQQHEQMAAPGAAK